MLSSFLLVIVSGRRAQPTHQAIEGSVRAALMTTGVKTPSRDGWLSRAGSVVATSDPAPHLQGFSKYTEDQTDNREEPKIFWATRRSRVSCSDHAALDCRGRLCGLAM